MIRHLRLRIAKLRREQFGHSAERHARLIEQLEMQLEDIETDIADDNANPQAYLADTLDRIHDHKINRLNELLPWNWAPLASVTDSQAA